MRRNYTMLSVRTGNFGSIGRSGNGNRGRGRGRGMRTFFAQVETRYRAIKNCPFTPAHVVKVFGGYMCFESDNDYRVWRNQK